MAENDRPRPEARFTFKDKTVRLALKPEYADRIRRDVKRGIELYGDLTEPYWQYVRALGRCATGSISTGTKYSTCTSGSSAP